MSVNPRLGWTSERAATLRKLWCEDGFSCSQIAKQLGGVSRNAVIGKLHPTGLSGRRTPSPPRTPRPTREPRPRLFVQPTPSPLMAEARRLAANGGGCMPSHSTTAEAVTVPALLPRHCRFPVGPTTGADQLFCGADKAGDSYCAAHEAVAYAASGKTRAEAARAGEKLAGWMDKLEGRRRRRVA